MPTLNGIKVTKSQKKKLTNNGIQNEVNNALKKHLKPRKRNTSSKANASGKGVVGTKGSSATKSLLSKLKKAPES